MWDFAAAGVLQWGREKIVAIVAVELFYGCERFPDEGKRRESRWERGLQWGERQP